MHRRGRLMAVVVLLSAWVTSSAAAQGHEQRLCQRAVECRWDPSVAECLEDLKGWEARQVAVGRAFVECILIQPCQDSTGAAAIKACQKYLIPLPPNETPAERFSRHYSYCLELDDAFACERACLDERPLNVHACERLGELYAAGRGVERDLDRAVVFYDRACFELDAGLACARAAKKLYAGDDGVEKSSRAALPYFKQGCDRWKLPICCEKKKEIMDASKP